MKYAVEIGSISMIWIPSFIKIGSGTQNLIAGTHRHTDSMVNSYFKMFRIRKIGYQGSGW
jgi:hypothetical protein